MQERERKGTKVSRKKFLVGAGSAVALVGLGACGPQSGGTGGGGAGAGQPVNLTIIDVAGNLQLSEDVIETFAEDNPDSVQQVSFTAATAPELPAKIQAQQRADQVSLAMALTGADGLSAGIEQDLWQEISSQFDADFINPAAQELAQGYGMLIAYGNYGPSFTYDPAKVPSPPATTDELLAFARQNDGQLMYARPANSGPGRTLIMGLPYLLGDSDPKAPDTWENTWSYLEELGQYIEYYPSGTSDTMEELGQGSRAMVASTMGWDMNPRVLGIVPKGFEALVLDETTFIADGHYAAIPKGLDSRTRDVSLDLISYMLTPEQQAVTYDQAYFYPGPAVKDATLDMAPPESKKAVESVRRPEFDRLIDELPIETQLEAKPLVRAFEIWDERVGGSKIREEES